MWFHFISLDTKFCGFHVVQLAMNSKIQQRIITFVENCTLEMEINDVQ
jgi:hypothetical protein